MACYQPINFDIFVAIYVIFMNNFTLSTKLKSFSAMQVKLLLLVCYVVIKMMQLFFSQ